MKNLTKQNPREHGDTIARTERHTSSARSSGRVRRLRPEGGASRRAAGFLTKSFVFHAVVVLLVSRVVWVSYRPPTRATIEVSPLTRVMIDEIFEEIAPVEEMVEPELDFRPELEPVPIPEPPPEPAPDPDPVICESIPPDTWATPIRLPRQAPRPMSEAPELASVSRELPKQRPVPAVSPVDRVTIVAPVPFPENRAPRYPDGARRLGLAGVVQVRLFISATGSVVRAMIACSSGHRLLDDAAIVAVRKWRFRPARRDGEPTETTVELPIRFQIPTS